MKARVCMSWQFELMISLSCILQRVHTRQTPHSYNVWIWNPIVTATLFRILPSLELSPRDELTDRLCKTQTPMDFFSVYALSHKHPPVIAPSLWEIPKHESNTDTWMDHWKGMEQGGCSFKYWTLLLWSHLVKVCIEIFPVGKNWQWVKLSRQNPVSNSPNWKPLEEFWEVCMVGK